MSWTEDKVDLLRQLWGSGKSASEIAEIIGGMTRNAVIGKAHRLGLSGRPSPIKRRKRVEAAEPKVGGATILNLTERMCRWPIGDPKQPGFRFCGRPTVQELPYCAEHAAMAYQQPAKRRDESQKAVG